MSHEEYLFLLYKGESADGRGWPKFMTYTTCAPVAEDHLKKCIANPYSNGTVEIMTKDKLVDLKLWYTQQGTLIGAVQQALKN